MVKENNDIYEGTIYSATSKIISRISGDYPDTAAIAAFRQSSELTSRTPMIVWHLVESSLDSKFLNPLSSELSRAEKAVFSALRVYGALQQGQLKVDHKPYFKEGNTFFQALNQFRNQAKSKKALDRRVTQALSCDDLRLLTNSIISLGKIMKTSNFIKPIDFALLASDFYRWQESYDSQSVIAYKWAKQYFNKVYSLAS